MPNGTGVGPSRSLLDGSRRGGIYGMPALRVAIDLDEKVARKIGRIDCLAATRVLDLLTTLRGISLEALLFEMLRRLLFRMGFRIANEPAGVALADRAPRARP
jgi:hypothetical protein